MTNKQDSNEPLSKQNLRPLMKNGTRKAIRILELTSEDDNEEVIKSIKSALEIKATKAQSQS